jgi:hypothetical protein
MALAAAKADSSGAMHTGAADMMSRIFFALLIYWAASWLNRFAVATH